jgi:hypothetical protein
MEEYRVSRVVALVAFTFMSVHFKMPKVQSVADC